MFIVVMLLYDVIGLLDKYHMQLSWRQYGKLIILSEVCSYVWQNLNAVYYLRTSKYNIHISQPCVD